MATEVLRLGSDGRLIWTIPMDTVFERVFKTAQALSPPPTLEKTLEMIRRGLLEKYPKLQQHLGIPQVRSRYSWFRRNFPKEYAFRIANKPDRQVQAVADVIDSEKRRKLDAIETLFPTYEVNERLGKIETRLAAMEDRLGLLVNGVSALEESLPAHIETILAQMTLLLTDLGVPEHKVLEVLNRAKKKSDAAGTASEPAKPAFRVVTQQG